MPARRARAVPTCAQAATISAPMTAEDTPGFPKRPRRTGVCSWSLQPDSPSDLVAKVRAAGLDCVQLALAPKGLSNASVTHTASALGEAGIEIRSGMLSMEGEDYSTLGSIRATGGLRPRCDLGREPRGGARERDPGGAARAAARHLPCRLPAGGAGAAPSAPRSSNASPGPSTRSPRQGVRVGLETGQETAATLLGVLAELELDRRSASISTRRTCCSTAWAIRSRRCACSPTASSRCTSRTPAAAPSPGSGARRSRWARARSTGRPSSACSPSAGSPVDLVIEREAGGERVADVRRARELALRSTALDPHREAQAERGAARRTAPGGARRTMSAERRADRHRRDRARLHGPRAPRGLARRRPGGAREPPRRGVRPRPRATRGRARASAGNLRRGRTGAAAGRAVRPGRVRADAEPRSPRRPATSSSSASARTRDTHVELALAALRAGKHVLVEKPVALDAASVGRLARAARRSAGRCACPRCACASGPAGTGCASASAAGTFGRRAAAPPSSAWPARRPGAASSTATPSSAAARCSTCTCTTPTSCAGASADPASTSRIDTAALEPRDHALPLSRRPRARRRRGRLGRERRASRSACATSSSFETATAEYDSRRDPPLEITHAGRVETPKLEPGTGWEHEVRHALECVSAGRTKAGVTLADAAAVTRILRAEEHAIHSQRRET